MKHLASFVFSLALIASNVSANEPMLLGQLPTSLIPGANVSAGRLVGPAGTAQFGNLDSQGTMMVQAVAQGEDVPFHIKNVSQSVGSAATGSPTATLDLKTDLNTHFKKTHTTTINGKTVYVSGVFDNEQNAFMSVWVEGDAKPQILNIAGLLEAEGSVTIGGKEHAVEIQANPLKPKRSRINIYDPNGDEESAIRLGSLLNKIQAAGLAIKIGGTDYRIFYTDGVGDGPKLDPTKRLFSIITTDAEGDIHVFLVLESLVPSDKIAVFKVLNDKRLGLKQVNGKLEIYDNP